MTYNLNVPVTNMDGGLIMQNDTKPATVGDIVRRIVGDIPAPPGHMRTVAEQVAAFELFKMVRDRPEACELSKEQVETIRSAAAIAVSPFLFGQINDVLIAQ